MKIQYTHPIPCLCNILYYHPLQTNAKSNAGIYGLFWLLDVQILQIQDSYNPSTVLKVLSSMYLIRNFSLFKNLLRMKN